MNNWYKINWYMVCRVTERIFEIKLTIQKTKFFSFFFCSISLSHVFSSSTFFPIQGKKWIPFASGSSFLSITFFPWFEPLTVLWCLNGKRKRLVLYLLDYLSSSSALLPFLFSNFFFIFFTPLFPWLFAYFLVVIP